MAKNVSTEALAGLIVLLLLSPAAAGDRPVGVGAMPPVVGASERVVADPHSGLAVGGFDPVGYFLHAAPVAGLPEFELIWSGVAWRFASEANREAFRRDPEIYAPRFGGHDPVAMAQGRPIAADPTLFAVVAERLYLFRDEASRTRFLAEPALAERAAARWRELRPGLVGN